MSCISPLTLEELCLDFISCNIENMCREVLDDGWKLVFKFPVFLHEHLAEDLMRKLSGRNKLSPRVLTLFQDRRTCRLKRLFARNADLPETSLGRVMVQHNVSELDLCGSNMKLSELFCNCADNCLLSLQAVNFRNINDTDFSPLYKLKSLRKLDLSRTILQNCDLHLISDCLVYLEHINISETNINDPFCFGNLKKRLKTLLAYDAPVAWNDPLEFAGFSSLLKLDISRNPDNNLGYDWPSDGEKVEQLLQAWQSLPKLIYLDLSGTPRIMDKALQEFLSSHPKLTFLGLCKTGVTSFGDFFPADIEVTGEATEKQILAALRKYPGRSSYMTEVLRRLFHLSKNWTEKNVHVLQLVITPMELHPTDLRVQMAATKIANLTLMAMENFPGKHELLRNCLLILDSPRMLKDVKFDRYLASSLAMDALCTYSNDLNITRLATKITAALSSRISSSETVALGKEKYFERLLATIREKLEPAQVDITLSLSLSCLWNLTDEAPSSCETLVKLKGLDTIVHLLKTFPSENELVTKALGTMNNVAEVQGLRRYLMTDELISKLSSMLRNEGLEVSYFAGGIISNIAIDWPGAKGFPVKSETKEDILKVLEQKVLSWSQPDFEMVAYRSFIPFIPLLKCDPMPAVQLWALFGIRHMFCKNAARYVPLAQRDGVVGIVQRLANSTINNNRDVKKAALLLLEEMEPYRSPKVLRCKIMHMHN